MSEELGAYGDLLVTSFFGGTARGRCLQFTPSGSVGYAQLTRAEVEDLRDELTDWLGERGSVDGGARALQEPSEAAIEAAAFELSRGNDPRPASVLRSVAQRMLRAAYRVDFGASGAAPDEGRPPVESRSTSKHEWVAPLTPTSAARRAAWEAYRSEHEKSGISNSVVGLDAALDAAYAVDRGGAPAVPQFGDRGPEPSGSWEVRRVGTAPYNGPFTWGVIRPPEACFTAIAATERDAERVCQALNRVASAAPAPDKETP